MIEISSNNGALTPTCHRPGAAASLQLVRFRGMIGPSRTYSGSAETSCGNVIHMGYPQDNPQVVKSFCKLVITPESRARYIKRTGQSTLELSNFKPHIMTSQSMRTRCTRITKWKIQVPLSLSVD